jgi:hypothetical protein
MVHVVLRFKDRAEQNPGHEWLPILFRRRVGAITIIEVEVFDATDGPNRSCRYMYIRPRTALHSPERASDAIARS